MRRTHALENGRLLLDPTFLEKGEADTLLATLLRDVPWRRDEVRMFGRVHEAPRLTAWIGDPGAVYRYSGTTYAPLPWLPALEALRARLLSEVPEAGWNAVLANRYRDGGDHMGWHADDEPELGPDPWVASVSLGAARAFQLVPKAGPASARVDLELGHGSLLVMAPPTQRYWKHRVPRRRRITEERVNLTFRAVSTLRSGAE